MNPDFLLITIPIILFALTVHEYSHAFAASRLGDDTARELGRLTLNPLKHLDIFGTLLMVIAGFGWAKPVPVNAANLKNPKTDMLLVAAAGPASNLILATAAGISLRILPTSDFPELFSFITQELLFKFLTLTLLYNTALAVFNLLPLPPLDGSRIVYGLLPVSAGNQYRKIEPFGIIILFGLFMFGHDIFGRFLWYPVSMITNTLAGVPVL